jgi:hypothetical protein
MNDNNEVTKNLTDTAAISESPRQAVTAVLAEREEDEGDDGFDEEDEEVCGPEWSDYFASARHHAQHPLAHDAAARCLLALIVDGCCKGTGPFGQPAGVTAAVPYGNTVFPGGLFIVWQGPILGDGDSTVALAVVKLRAWLPTVGLTEIGFSDEPPGIPLRTWVMLLAIDRASLHLGRDTFGRPAHEDVVREMIQSFIEESYTYVTENGVVRDWPGVIAHGAGQDGVQGASVGPLE